MNNLVLPLGLLLSTLFVDFSTFIEDLIDHFSKDSVAQKVFVLDAIETQNNIDKF